MVVTEVQEVQEVLTAQQEQDLLINQEMEVTMVEVEVGINPA